MTLKERIERAIDKNEDTLSELYEDKKELQSIRYRDRTTMKNYDVLLSNINAYIGEIDAYMKVLKWIKEEELCKNLMDI